MKKATKIKLLGALGLVMGAVVLSSCTASFCTNLDRAHIAYAYEQGVTVYCNQEDIPEEYADLAWKVFDDNEDIYAYIPVNTGGSYTAKKAQRLHDEIIPSAISNNVTVPSYDYFKMMDQKVLEAALEASDFTSATITIDQINPFNLPDVTGNEPGVTVNKDSILRNYGYLKFYGEDGNLYTNWNKWNNEIATVIGAANVPSQDFINIYQNNMAYVINNARGCAATVTGNYGHYGQQNNWSVSIEGKDWGFAWSKGFLEGLIVYPVSWLIDNIALGIDPALSGLGQILSIVIVTIIVRLVVMGLTLKSTMDQQKTQAIQPQLAKLQAKYPNSNTSQAEKTRLAQEQMALYKRNHISPFSMILVAIVQFPVFIAVWGALSGNAILTSGELLNMPLSTPISSILFNFSGEWYLNSTGFWTALVLFILMAVGQWLAMMLPQWINKRRIKKAVTRTTANPAQDKNTRRMKIFTYVMLGVTILMGFALPSAMGIYWFIGAIVSMLQTIFTQLWIAKREKKSKNL